MAEIHERFTRLMLQEGNLPAALDHAEEDLALNPTNPLIAYRAADLALALLQTDRAGRILHIFQVNQGVFPTGLLGMGSDALDLYCLVIEKALNAAREEDGGNIDEITRWVDDGLVRQPGCLRLQAAHARLQARQGDFTSAWQQYQQVRAAMKNIVAAGEPCWLAELALEVQAWEEALQLFEQITRVHPEEARGFLGFARALVLCAERERLCETTGCRANAPGVHVIDETHHQKLEEAIRSTGRLANGCESGAGMPAGRQSSAPRRRTRAPWPPCRLTR